MKKTLFKDLTREIKKTYKRYLSIILITILGVGFFVGIRVVGLDMKTTGNKYFNETNLMDVRFVSNYGFDELDLNAIKQNKDIEALLPAYSTQGLFSYKDKEFCVNVHSIPKDGSSKVMTPIITTGRLPENENECVIDKKYFKTSKLKLGDIITLKDTSGTKLNVKKFKIVGAISWSYYVSDVYGKTNLGTGDISSYILVNNEAFDSEVYTDIFVKIKGLNKINTYSNEYDNKVANFKDSFKNTISLREINRLNEIKEDAFKEINDAINTLKNEEEKAYSKLNAAKKKLDSSKKTLNYSKQTLLNQEISFKESIKQQYALWQNSYNDYLINKQAYDSALPGLNANINNLKSIYDQAVIDFGENSTEALEAKQNLDNAILGLETYTNQINNAKNQLDSAKVLLDKTNSETLKKFEDGKNKINSGLKQISAGYSLYYKNKNTALNSFKDARQEINDGLKEVNDLEDVKWYVLDRSAIQSFSNFEEDANKIGAVAQVFPLIFFLVASLVCLTTMTRMIEEDRTNIGVLKALGYSKLDISSKYILYSFSASLIGSLIGFALGFSFVPNMIYNAYRILYSTPDLYTPIYLNYILIGLLLGVLSTVGASYLAVRSELKEVCASLLRPKIITSGGKNILEKMPFIWNKLSFNFKITIRNLFRYKKRFFMSVIGIGACTCLLTVGFAIRYSVTSMIPLQFNTVMTYDLETGLKEDLKDTEVNNVLTSYKENDKITDSIQILKSPAYLVDKKDYVMNIIVSKNNTNFNDYYTLKEINDNKRVEIPSDGILLTSRIADMLNIKKGDKIKLKLADDKIYEVKVKDIVRNYVFHYAYMSEDFYTSLTNETPYYNTIVSKIKNISEINDKEFTKKLLLNDNISGVAMNKTLETSFAKELASLDFVIMIIIISAGALAFIVLFNLDNINVSERKRELATIKVLGFTNREVNFYLLRENIILTIFGIVLGLLVSKDFHRYLMKTVAVDFVEFYNGITISSYIYAVIMTFVFAFIVNIALKRTLKKINMVESLKSVE